MFEQAGRSRREPIRHAHPQGTRNVKSIIDNTILGVPRALSLYRAGRFKLDELVAQRYPLDAINEALDALRAETAGRGVLVY